MNLMASTAMGTQTDVAPEFPIQPAPVKTGGKLRKAVFAAFAGAVTFGLALSGWYLGNRIHAEGTNFTTAATTMPVVASVEVATKAESPAPVTAVATDLKSLQPEFYLEVAALGSVQDAKYLSRLTARGFDARLEDSAANQGGRILIGPYATRAALQQASRKLAAAGILAIEATP